MARSASVLHSREAADVPEGRKDAASDLGFPPGVLCVL